MNNHQIRVLFEIHKGAITSTILCRKLHKIIKARKRANLLKKLQEDGYITVSQPITGLKGVQPTKLALTEKGAEKIRELAEQDIIEI